MKRGVGNRESGIGKVRKRRPFAFANPGFQQTHVWSSRLPTPGRATRANGFTLLEMLAVILLIGIAAAAVSISVTQGLASARVRAASSELAGALRATRAQAIVRAQEQHFDVDTRTNSYDDAKRQNVRLPKGLRVSITSAKEDQPNDHTGRIRFFPDGSSTGGRITLRSGKREWHVNVSWLTGEVRVVDAVASR
jgi:general secretion pathway protein H